MEKYKLLHNKTIQKQGETLYRIKSLIDIKDKKGNIIVKKGDKGGYVQHLGNLSHEDTCWVYDNAMVYQRARIYRHCKVKDEAEVSGDALLLVDAVIKGRAKIFGSAKIFSGVWTTGPKMLVCDCEATIESELGEYFEEYSNSFNRETR